MDSLFKKRIFKRYLRTTMAHPEGAVAHHGDCEFFVIQICTCGLLHDLKPEPKEAREIYPMVDVETQEHDEARDRIMDNE